MVSHTATPHLPFQPARLITSVLRPCRSVLPAIFALSTTLIVSACGVSGGSSVWGNAPSGPGLGTPQTPTAQSATRGDAPEGTPGANDALTGMGGSTLALGDSGYLTPPPDAVRQIEGIPVAILVPLSGRLAGPGKALLEGAQMALFDVGNPEFRLMPFDTMGTPLGAEQAARSAINKGAQTDCRGGQYQGCRLLQLQPCCRRPHISGRFYTRRTGGCHRCPCHGGRATSVCHPGTLQ